MCRPDWKAYSAALAESDVRTRFRSADWPAGQIASATIVSDGKLAPAVGHTELAAA